MLLLVMVGELLRQLLPLARLTFRDSHTQLYIHIFKKKKDRYEFQKKKKCTGYTLDKFTNWGFTSRRAVMVTVRGRREEGEEKREVGETVR